MHKKTEYLLKKQFSLLFFQFTKILFKIKFVDYSVCVY